MPSARKLHRLRQKRKQKSAFHFNFQLKIPNFSIRGKKIAVALSISCCLVFVLFSAYLFQHKNFWDGENKLAIAVHKPDGAAVILFDPQYDEVVTITVPEHTEIDVAHDLGIWKIETVWELGKQHKLGGQLLSESLTKYFRFPTGAWADTPALGLASGNFSDLYKAVFGIYNSNLSVGDRLSLAWFSFNVSNAKRIEIPLEKTGYVIPKTLSDGTKGYGKVDPAPASVLSLFADSEFAKASYAVSIKDATGEAFIARNVGQVVEVLGAKIASVSDTDIREIDCIVRGRSELLRERIAQLFNCKKEEGESSFDGELIIGTEFAKRF